MSTAEQSPNSINSSKKGVSMAATACCNSTPGRQPVKQPIVLPDAYPCHIAEDSWSWAWSTPASSTRIALHFIIAWTASLHRPRDVALQSTARRTQHTATCPLFQLGRQRHWQRARAPVLSDCTPDAQGGACSSKCQQSFCQPCQIGVQAPVYDGLSNNLR